MPYDIKKQKGKFRIVEKATGRIAKNKAGTAIDGGGYGSEAQAKKQQAAVNISYAKEKGHKIPPKSKARYE